LIDFRHIPPTCLPTACSPAIGTPHISISISIIKLDIYTTGTTSLLFSSVLTLYNHSPLPLPFFYHHHTTHTFHPQSCLPPKTSKTQQCTKRSSIGQKHSKKVRFPLSARGRMTPTSMFDPIPPSLKTISTNNTLPQIPVRLQQRVLLRSSPWHSSSGPEQPPQGPLRAVCRTDDCVSFCGSETFE